MQFELTTNILDSLILAIEEKNTAFLNKQLHDLYPQDIAIIINQFIVMHNNHALHYAVEYFCEVCHQNVMLPLAVNV